MKRILVVAAVVAVVALGAGVAVAGEYHAGSTLVCFDCHTIHFSQQHGFSGGAVGATPALGGNWLSATGPSEYLLKVPEVCQSCHDGQAFAPDVVGANANASPTNGRQAGALTTGGAPHEDWKGHTIGSAATPPGFEPAIVGLSPWYNPVNGLSCLSCHLYHGIASSYRNLGPSSLGGTAGNFRPTYVISDTNDTTRDVWINLATYTAGSGVAATFNPFYSTANISFNRNDATITSAKTSNRIGTFCAACHANFHGGPGDTQIGGLGAPPRGFVRHPTSQVNIGALGGGHSNLGRFVAATTKIKVFASNADLSDASPGCISSHKAHGNQNPFGLIFLSRNAASVGEQGGFAAGQATDTATAMRNLCGQCHVQGN